MVDVTKVNDECIQDIAGRNVIKFEWCPGNGTRYEILVAKLNEYVSCGSLGAVEDGWLVVCGLTKTAYMFQPCGHLHTSYIKEKFNLVYDEDVKCITALVCFALDRPYIH